jgi:hypothetical protein
MADSLIELGPVRDELRHQLLLDRLAFVLGVATEFDKPLGILSNDLFGEWMACDFLCCDSH